MIEIFLDNKTGRVWNLSQIVSDITWKTTRIGKPGSLEFTLVRNGLYQSADFQYNNGDIIIFRYGGKDVFFGYVFKISEGKDENVNILCYDQIRYLMSSESYVFIDATAADILRRIAKDFNLKLGRVDDTGYRIPKMVEDNKKLIDIICKALDFTLIRSGRNFFLFDDFGALSIRDTQDMLVDFIIGDHSMLYDYTTERSIDSDTYNRVKLFRNNQNTGRRDVYIAQDSENIAKWGLLQFTQSLDENMNTAQIREQLDALITLKNRQTRKLRIDALGDIRVRAGCYVPVVIEERGINQPFLVDECTHRFEGGSHTMTLELKVI